MGPLFLILTVGILARMMLLPSSLIQENDVYRYVLDGQVLRAVGNPYAMAPTAFLARAPEPLKVRLEEPSARTTISRIGYPHIPTVYPPAAQLFFAAGTFLSGWEWSGQRWLFMAVDLAVMVILLSLLPVFDMARSWVLLYAWNPLVLKEVINSIHLDVLVSFFVLLLLLFLHRYLARDGVLWLSLSAAAAGMACLSKLYPVLLLPAVALMLWRRSKRVLPATGFLAGACALGVVGYLPFLSVGLRQVTEGLRTYASEWTMNEGVFSLIEAALPQPRWFGALIVLTIAIAVPLLRRSRTVLDLARDIQWILLFWFLFLPSAFPWYALPLVALLVLLPREKGASGASVALFGCVGLYYLSFFYEYHSFSPHWWTLTRIVEHSLIWLFLLLPLAGVRIPVGRRRVA